MKPVSPVPKNKNISHICVSKGNESSFQICVNYRKKLYLYDYSGTFDPIKEIQLHEEIKDMIWIGDHIYMAFENEYQYLNIHTNELTPITTYNGLPMIRTISNNKLFLLKDTQGIIYPLNDNNSNNLNAIQVAPLEWPSNPTNITIQYPYLISIHNDMVNFYSLFTWKLLHMIPLNRNTKGMKNILYIDPSFDMTSIDQYLPSDYLVGYTDNSIYAFTFLSPEKQSEALLRSNHIDDAIEVFRSTCSHLRNFNDKLLSLYSHAAMTCLKNLEFAKAFHLFDLANYSPITLLYDHFPHLIINNDRDINKELNIKELITSKKRHILKNEGEMESILLKCEQYLLKFLMKSKSKDIWDNDDSLIVIHAAIFIILLHTHPEDIWDFLDQTDQKLIPFDSLKSYCINKNEMYGLGLLYHKFNYDREALAVWKQFSESKSLTTGIDEAVKLLKKSKDINLIKEFSAWIYEKDESKFLSIFTSRNHETLLNEKDLLPFLNDINLELPEKYLSWLVFETNFSNEENEITLIKTYIRHIKLFLPEDKDAMLKTLNLNDRIKMYRDKLIRILREKSSYEPYTVLEVIGQLPLYEEQVILYQKINNHLAALKTIVYNLKDSQKALEYCFKNEKNNEDIFLNLLEIYIVSEKDKEIPERALNLLKDYPSKFNPIDVLKILPPSLPLSHISSFLYKTLRKSEHQHRYSKVVKNIEMNLNLDSKMMKYHQLKKCVIIKPKDLCAVCKKNIGESVFARFPNGVIVHYKCFQGLKNVHECPITHRNFLTDPM